MQLRIPMKKLATGALRAALRTMVHKHIHTHTPTPAGVMCGQRHAHGHLGRSDGLNHRLGRLDHKPPRTNFNTDCNDYSCCWQYLLLLPNAN